MFRTIVVNRYHTKTSGFPKFLIQITEQKITYELEGKIYKVLHKIKYVIRLYHKSPENIMRMRSNKKTILFPLKIKLLIAITLITITPKDAFSNDNIYTRKSITLVDLIIYDYQWLKMPPEMESGCVKNIKNKIQMERFDVNQISYKSLLEIFRKYKANGTNINLESFVKAELIPEISKILEVKKEIRARGLVTEQEKNSFICVKAKEYGVQMQHMLQVMNSAYIFWPFISNISKENNRIDGGLIIYRIEYDDEYSISKLKTIESFGFGNSLKEASSSLGAKLKLKLLEISDFKLKTQITSVSSKTIGFNIGTKEGLKIDQPFYIGEWIQKPGKPMELKKTGFVRVQNIADNMTNTAAESHAYIIKGGDISKGMTLIEHPSVGVDLAIKPETYKIKLEEGYLHEYGYSALFLPNVEMKYSGVDISLNINRSRRTGQSQKFLVFGFSYGKTKSNIPFLQAKFDNWSKLGIHLGTIKKYYFGQFAIHHEFAMGFDYMKLNPIVDDFYYVGVYLLKAKCHVGIEYALSIDCNLGAFVGLNINPGINVWDISLDVDEDDNTNYTDYSYKPLSPSMRSISPTLGLYMHYSIPKITAVSIPWLGIYRPE